jgi:hypothetical protein
MTMHQTPENHEPALELALSIIPWIFFAWMLLWCVHFGPRPNADWLVGNRTLYEICVLIQFAVSGFAVPLYALLRRYAFHHRSHLTWLIVLSGLVIILLTPAFNFA